jgi:hypothetical protein
MTWWGKEEEEEEEEKHPQLFPLHTAGNACL